MIPRISEGSKVLYPDSFFRFAFQTRVNGSRIMRKTGLGIDKKEIHASSSSIVLKREILIYVFIFIKKKKRRARQKKKEKKKGKKKTDCMIAYSEIKMKRASYQYM